MGFNSAFKGLNYDDQNVMSQVIYGHNCSNPIWKLDLYWKQKWVKLLRKKIPHKYCSYGHAL